MQRRALIVVDEPATSLLIEKALQSVGMEALTAPHSAEAATLLHEARFDLVFLDYHRAPGDGIELVRGFRDPRLHFTAPIVLISDDKNPGAMAKGFAAGASFFIYKPVEKRSVLQLVRATQGAMEKERRRTRRVPVHSKVHLRKELRELEGETVDMSMNGLLVRAPFTFPVGSSLDLRLHLSPSVQPIIGTGRVARILVPNQMGIHLGQLSPAESQRLQEFLLPLIPADLVSAPG
jgi:two-component system, chemotaxis family, chemotaxis protein CheY